MAACGFLATLAGLCATYFQNHIRCPNLTFGFIWQLVPVSAYVLIFPLSITAFSEFLKEHGEHIFSLYGVIAWGALAHGMFLLPMVLMSFPDERFFRVGATCDYYGQTYFSSVVGPFALTQSAVWIISMACIAWLKATPLKR